MYNRLLFSGDSKPFFNYLKENKNENSIVIIIVIIPDLNKYQSQLARAPVEKASLLNSFLESVFVKDDGQTPTIQSGATYADNSDLIISKQGVLGLLEKLYSNKTGGSDFVNNRQDRRFAYDLGYWLAGLTHCDCRLNKSLIIYCINYIINYKTFVDKHNT